MAVDWTKVRHFKPEEFACKCGCGLNNPNPQVIYDVDACRERLGLPLTITSGCRCSKHDADPAVGGTGHGPHTPSPANGECDAVDIAAVADTLKFRILEFFFKLGYVRLESSNLHVHVDRAQYRLPWPWFGVKWIGK
jgi:hypothetical protein